MEIQFNRRDSSEHNPKNEDGFCRLCFIESNTMVQLFPEDMSPNRDLLWKILECTTLKLNFESDQTAQICQKCIEKMTDFCDYRMQCLRNNKKIDQRRQFTSKRAHAAEKEITEKYPVIKILDKEGQSDEHHEEVEYDIRKNGDDDDDDAIDDGNENLILEETSSSVQKEQSIEDDIHDAEDDVNENLIHEEASSTVQKEQSIEDDIHDAEDDGNENLILEETSSTVQKEQSIEDDNHMSLVEDVHPPNESDVSMIEQHKIHEKKKRTRKILLYDDHTYQLLSSRPKSDSITWGCIWRKTKNCRGTIGTKASGLILGNVIPQHNHPALPVDESKHRRALVIRAFRKVENVFLDEPYEIIKNRIGGDMLVYDGDRYPYSHSRKDGCRVWKCNSHRKCTVSIYLCPDGRIFKQANSQHSEEKVPHKRNHSMEGGSDASENDISSIEKLYPTPQSTFNYKIVKNANKRNVLIYEGDRYSFYYRKTNGWIVWRCTVAKGCMAMIYQLCDESVVALSNTTHNHARPTDGH